MARSVSRCLVAVLFVGTGAYAEDQTLGTIDDVDANLSQLLLENGRVVDLTRAVELYRNDTPVDLDALEPGDAVRASYDEHGGLRRVDVTSADELGSSEPGWDAPRRR